MEKNQNNVIFETTIHCLFSLKLASIFPAKLSVKFSVWRHQKFVGISPLLQ
jgi:hypothetical protein